METPGAEVSETASKKVDPDWDDYVSQFGSLFNTEDFKDKTLLEIASGTCDYYKLYLDKGIKKYISVEPNHSWQRIAKNKLIYNEIAKEYKFITSTYEKFERTEKIDIIICAGLLYHLISPFHFLEKLYELDADTVGLETTNHLVDDTLETIWDDADEFAQSISFRHQGRLVAEPLNDDGMRRTEQRPGGTFKKGIPLNMSLSPELTVWCMKQLSYELSGYTNVSYKNSSKDASCMMVFRKIREL